MENQKKQPKMCGHCGGPLRQDFDGLRCFMCSRSMNHECEGCLFPNQKAGFLKPRRKRAA